MTKKYREIEIGYDTWYEIVQTDNKIIYEYYAPSMFISQNYRVIIKRLFDNTYEIDYLNSDDGDPWTKYEFGSSKITNKLLKDAKKIFNKNPIKEVTRSDLIDLGED
jgi:hypothetical protein